MDEHTVADLKQCIAATISQQLSSHLSDIHAKLDDLENKLDGLDKKIDNKFWLQ